MDFTREDKQGLGMLVCMRDGKLQAAGDALCPCWGERTRTGEKAPPSPGPRSSSEEILKRVLKTDNSLDNLSEQVFQVFYSCGETGTIQPVLASVDDISSESQSGPLDAISQPAAMERFILGSA
ncbi:uncharacterized protein AAES06_015666 [Glossophaga mutica]